MYSPVEGQYLQHKAIPVYIPVEGQYLQHKAVPTTQGREEGSKHFELIILSQGLSELCFQTFVPR